MTQTENEYLNKLGFTEDQKKAYDVLLNSPLMSSSNLEERRKKAGLEDRNGPE